MKKPGNPIGAVLRDLRKEYENPYGDKKFGISQANLSKGAGVAINTVQLYEAGTAVPWKNLEKILDFLGYELEIVKR